MLKRLHVILLYCIPHHFLSRIMYHLTRSRSLPGFARLKRWYVRSYKLNVGEAVQTDIDAYPTMNEFFTRAIKPEARPIDPRPPSIASPADGAISALGPIHEGLIYQAKKHNYTLTELLGGSEERATPFMNGKFATIYLSPKDYHRVHMPCRGTLKQMIHVPGRLFSVAPAFVESVPNLFARNERVISIFYTEFGQVAVILVGAIFVSSIETVWAGPLLPPRARRVVTTDFPQTQQAITLNKGEEMGRFNMGSTVILLCANSNLQWDQSLQAHTEVRLGQSLGLINPA